MTLVESTLALAAARQRHTVVAGEPWMGRIQQGQRLRIADAAGTQNVAALFYRADALDERYSSHDTVRAQGNVYLTSGSTLLSNEGNVMLTIVADTCGRHDTLGGACSAESYSVRYGSERRYAHSCRDNFLLALAKWGTQHCRGVDKRDLSGNVNFFVSAPFGSTHRPTAPDVGRGGTRYVELCAEMDLIVLMSNCPQSGESRGGANPASIELLIWD
jgi:uncharacterized protein